MSLWKIAWRSIQQRALASFLTGLSMALGVALVVTVLVTHGVISDSFERGTGLGYDIIVGAEKGGKLQIVLNTVYHLSTPVENIPWSFYKEFTEGKYKDLVGRVIPCCLGDNYEGYRVMGTTTAMLEPVEFGPQFKFASGRNFTEEEFFSGVIGSMVAQATNLKVGDEFNPTHGVADDGQGHEHDPFTIVGVLEPTGTPNDRALFVNIEGFYLLAKHSKPAPKDATPESGGQFTLVEPESGNSLAPIQGSGGHEGHNHSHEPLPESQREVTALLVRSSSPIAGVHLPRMINEGDIGQAVMPIREIQALFQTIVGPIQYILLFLAVLVVIVSGIGILVSIYNSMSDRRREIAIMRALGARRNTVMLVVLFESILLSLVGGMAGWLLGHGLISAISPAILTRTGVSIGFLHFVPVELALIPSLIGLASIVGILPAISAYRTDVSKSLVASP